jgi:hypothetical protein
MKKLLGLAVCVLGLPHLNYAQEPVAAPSSDAGSDSSVAATTPVSNQNASTTTEGMLSRWLDINTFSSSLRYRSTENLGGFHTFQFGQHRELLDGAFKFDKAGRYEIKFQASSDRYFNWNRENDSNKIHLIC